MDLILAIPGLRDRVGIAAETERLARLFHHAEPGLLDELEQAGRRRGPGLEAGFEVGFDLGGGKEIFEARAGGLGRLPDRVRYRRDGLLGWLLGGRAGNRLRLEMDRHAARPARGGCYESCRMLTIMVNGTLTSAPATDRGTE